MNKVLPFLLLIALIVLGTTVYVATRTPQSAAIHSVNKAPPVPGDLRMRPTGKPGDRDDPLETIRTLTELQEKTLRAAEEDRRKNAEMRADMDRRITQGVNSKLEAELKTLRKNIDDKTRDVDKQYRMKIRTLEREIANTKDDLKKQRSKNTGPALNQKLAHDFGLDAGASLAKPNRYDSIKPLGTEMATEFPASGTVDKTRQLLQKSKPGLPENVTHKKRVLQSMSKATNDTSQQGSGYTPARTSLKTNPGDPVYTINNGATLFSNTTMTALMGKVPIGGKIVDPFRFKVVSGTENLASSQQHLAESIAHIIWTGYTTGSREQSCVSGYLDTVSLIFDDGTISTTSVKQTGSRENEQIKYLGYLSDAWGKPCIKGQLYDNATQYLQDRIGLSAIASAAEAASALETSTRRTDSGSSVTSVTGDAGAFIAGSTLAGAAGETLDYYKDRMANGFDLVYVPTGSIVTIHVEGEIAFNHNPNGRRLRHASTMTPELTPLD